MKGIEDTPRSEAVPSPIVHKPRCDPCAKRYFLDGLIRQRIQRVVVITDVIGELHPMVGS